MSKTNIIFLFIIMALAAATDCYAQKSHVYVGNLHIYHLFEKPDSIKNNGKDTVWANYKVSYVTDSPTRIKDFYICIGSSSDTSDIFYKKITLANKDGKLHAMGGYYNDVVIRGYVISTVIRVKKQDMNRFDKFSIYAEDINNKECSKIFLNRH